MQWDRGARACHFPQVERGVDFGQIPRQRYMHQPVRTTDNAGENPR
jgi:hypothetical protein